MPRPTRLGASPASAARAAEGRSGGAEIRYAGTPGVDPYVDWVLGPGRPHYFQPGRQQKWMSILLRLADGVTPMAFANGSGVITNASERRRYKKAIHIPDFYRRQKQRTGEIFCMAFVTEEFFRTLSVYPALAEGATRITLGLPLDANSLSIAKNKKKTKKKSPRKARP